MTSIDNVSDERLRMFIECALPYRTLEVQISRGDERRLARHIAAVNRDLPEDPMDPTNDSDLATAFAGEDRFERVFKRRDILEYGDLRTASRFWKHGDRLATLDDHVAAVTMHALAIETLFPALADRLPS